ncbi:MAG: [FeFe] hydrogenase H-cluster maturation GTPase HydF [Anaerovoracaceae bacterium]
MSLNKQVSTERIHIGFFGLRNAGKSSLVNAITNQSLSIVSNIKGTTTDPVSKAMELLPIGPVLIIDTPGLDDEGSLGKMRVQKAKDILRKTDIAILVTDSTKPLSPLEVELIGIFVEKEIPYIIVKNKVDLLQSIPEDIDNNSIYVSSINNINIEELKEKIGLLSQKGSINKQIIGDIISAKDVVVLVTPIDGSAPKGRLILPQQQTIRDILDSGAIAMVTKETELLSTINALSKKPSMVITDSKVFSQVKDILPKDIPLTSFSILFARYKGDLDIVVKGALNLDKLKDRDKVLISEGCTHHKQCDDIGTIVLPKMIKKYTGKYLDFQFTSGGEFKDDLSDYALVVHCGGCMLNEREMKYRIKTAKAANIPISNYGIVMAQINGILTRAIEPFTI